MQFFLLIVIFLSLLPTFPIGVVADVYWSGISTWAAVALVALGSWATGAGFSRIWNHQGRVFRLVWYRGLRATLSLGAGAVQLASLTLFSWGYLIREHWGLREWVLVDELLILSPLIVSLVSVWWGIYPSEKILHAHWKFPVAGSFWTRRGYVVFQFRTHAAILLAPFLLYVAIQETGLTIEPTALQEEEDGWALYPLAVSVMAVLTVLMILPWLLVRIWDTETLPAGELRIMLMQTAQRLGFRYTDFRIWHTKKVVGNAMVTGILPWPRYVVFTDGLLEALSPHELIAVLGHEIGHIRRWHLPLYFGLCVLATLSGIQILSLCLPDQKHYLVSLLFRLPNGQMNWSDSVALILSMTVLWGYVWLIFGYVSRHCEREADVYGCLAASCGRAGCSENHQTQRLTAGDCERLCPAGIRTFISALEKVSDLNGLPRAQWSWRHGSIARRIAYLEKLQEHVLRGMAWPKRLWLPSWGLCIVLLLSVLVVHWMGQTIF